MKILKNGGIFLKILTVLLSIYLYFKAKKKINLILKYINKYSLILCSVVGFNGYFSLIL